MRLLGDELNECLFRLLMTVITVSLTWSMRLCEQSGFALDSEFWCHESHGETFCSADPQVEGRSVLWTWVYSGVVSVLMALQVGRLRSPSQFLFPQALEGMLKDDGDMKHVGDESAGVDATTYNNALREWDIRDVTSNLESLFVNSLER